MNNAWDLFAKRLEDPTAALVRLGDQLLSLSPEDAVTLARSVIDPMDDARLQQFRRTLQLRRFLAGQRAQTNLPGDTTSTSDAGREHIPTLDALLSCLEAELAQRAQGMSALQPPSSQKLAAYSALLDRFNHTLAAATPAQIGECIAEMRQIRAAAERLMEEEPRAYLRIDLAELINDALAALADFYKAKGDTDQAEEYYEQAVQTAVDHGLTTRADGYRLKLGELLFARQGDVDRALRGLLPLHEEMSRGQPSLNRVKVTLLLASAYMRVGDVFGGNQMIQAARDDLLTLGFTPPTVEQIPVGDWIRVADGMTSAPNEFREAIYGVLIAYMTMASLDSQTAVSAEQQATSVALINALEQLYNELSSREEEIVRRDQEALASLSPSPIPEPPPPKPAWPGFQQEWSDLGRRVDALRAGQDRGESAESLLHEAKSLLAEARRMHAERIAGLILDVQADLLLQLGRFTDAVATWRAASEAALNAGFMDDALDRLTSLLGACAERQEHALVSQVCGEAIDLIERNRYKVSPEYLQGAFLQKKVHFYVLGALSAYKLSNYDLMLQRMELAKARASLRQFLQRPAQVDRAEVDELEKELRQINMALQDADSETVQALRAKRRILWDLRSIQRAEANRRQFTPGFSLKAVQSTLSPDEAVINYFWLQPGVLMVIALDRDRVVVERCIFSDEEYAHLVNTVETLGVFDRNRLPHIKSKIAAFSSHLLPTEVQDLLQAKRRLVVSPHRLLHAFPFHALPWEDDYLVVRLAVTYVPNLISLLVGRAPVNTRGVLAVGVTEFAIPDWPVPPLSHAQQELDDLVAIYQTRGEEVETLRDADANLARMRNLAETGRLSSFRILHLATHGADVLKDTPLETYLLLHDGQLDGLEIADWRLNAEVVVLSACYAGRRVVQGRGLAELPGDEMFGLQSAFFEAGAQHVVGALWPVQDRIARRIMAGFHRHLGDLTPEFALQASIVDYIRNADPFSRDPFYWAPFFLSAVGRGTE